MSDPGDRSARSDPGDRSARNVAKSYRQSYTEDDIQALISSSRFVVAVDAYGAGRCVLEQMLKLAFTEPPYLPRNLHIKAFARLVIEVVRRIKEGELQVPEEWKKKYSDFYRQQPEPPLDEFPFTQGGTT